MKSTGCKTCVPKKKRINVIFYEKRRLSFTSKILREIKFHDKNESTSHLISLEVRKKDDSNISPFTK